MLVLSHLRYWLLVCVCFLAVKTARANIIDSLYTREDVRRFLAANFEKSGLISLYSYANISQAEKIRLYYSLYDTIAVEDTVKGGYVIKTIPREYNAEHSLFNDIQTPSNCEYQEIDSIMNEFPFHFYKTDIDRNGRTDLVVNAGVVVIVMDLQDKFEGHLFSQVADSARLSFKDLVVLPDSIIGLVFMHSQCKSGKLDQIADHKADTIVYKFHGLACYNSNFRPVHISKVYYHYMRSYGTTRDGYDCMEIDKYGKCLLQYSMYNTTYTGSIDTKRVAMLWNLIAYTGVDLIKGTFSSSIDHTDGITFTVFFDDRSIKEISFYGCHPSLGLTYVSKNISDISRDVKWQSSNKNSNIECPCKYVNTDKRTDCDCGL